MLTRLAFDARIPWSQAWKSGQQDSSLHDGAVSILVMEDVMPNDAFAGFCGDFWEAGGGLDCVVHCSSLLWQHTPAAQTMHEQHLIPTGWLQKGIDEDRVSFQQVCPLRITTWSCRG